MKNLFALLKKLFGQPPADPPPPEEVAFMAPNLDMNVTQLGRFAQSAIKNPAIAAALDKMEVDLASAWRRSTPAQGKEREHLYYRQEAISAFKAKLQGMINNMLVEQHVEKQKQSSASSLRAVQGR
jgi:hypothetical protein